MTVRNVTIADCAGNAFDVVGDSYFNAALDNVQIVGADASNAVVFLDFSTVAYNANVGVYADVHSDLPGVSTSSGGGTAWLWYRLVPQQYRAYDRVFRIAGFYRHVTEECS